MTQLACIVGWPVAQSLSPAMHNAAFEALGLDWTYVPLAVQPGAIAEGVGLLRTLGVDGANVTVPHKVDIVPLLDRIEGDAETFGAVNTIVRDGDALVGRNTDGAGFIRFLRTEARFEPAGSDAVVLGAGGAARAVALALTAEGAHVTITARRRPQADDIAERGGRLTGRPATEAIDVVDWGKAPKKADLVVNATSTRDELPVPKAKVAVDLIYLPPETAFQAAARATGAAVYDGLGMLVAQAELSFAMWTGVEPPAGVMRSAAERVISGQTGIP